MTVNNLIPHLHLDIFIVDDSACHNVFLGNLLEHKGHNVTAFDNGHILLNSLDNSLPDLIISDIEMPAINGLALFEKVRDKKSDIKIPFLFVSSLQTKEIIERIDMLEAGFYLMKPLQEDLLIKTLSQIVLKYSINDKI